MGAMKNVGDKIRGALWTAAVLGTSFALAAPGAAAQAPASEYEARPVCHAPMPGYASCLALTLAPRTVAARARTHVPAATQATVLGTAKTAAECAHIYPACLTPQDLNDAYFPGETPEATESQTVALVDAYDDPEAETDLRVYDEAFGLSALSACDGAKTACFEKVNQDGETDNLPSPHNTSATKEREEECDRQPTCEKEVEEYEVEQAKGWALETSTDIETAHAICQNCRIVLVEAENPAYYNLAVAENTAANAVGAQEISNSWGGAETDLTNAEIAAFDHPGVAITASAGDDGYLNWDLGESEPLDLDEPNFPAASPDVVAVGGTKLTLSSGDTWSAESVWNEDPSPETGRDEGATGGGCSLRFKAQEWQQSVPDWSTVGCEHRRAVADVAADADPSTGVAIYDSVPYPYEEKGKRLSTVLNWVPVGGTSLASPIIASMFALAGGAQEVEYPAKTLYSHLGSKLLHDVTSGGNGECDDDYLHGCEGSMDPLSPLDCGERALICNAASGYDGPTGVGTPDGIGAFTKTGEGQSGSGNPGSKGGNDGNGGGSSGSGTGGNESKEETSNNTKEQTNTSTVPESAGNTTPEQPATKPTAPSPATTTATKQTPRISFLTLTTAARAALHRHHPAGNQLAFACVLTQAVTVHVTLSFETRSAGHTRWRTLPGSFAFNAIKGLSSHRLRDTAHLAPGTYRLTLTPANGAPRSISIHVA